MGPVWPALSWIDARPKTPLVAAMVAPETAKYLRSRRKDRHVIFHLRSTGYKDSSAIRTATFASSSAVRTLDVSQCRAIACRATPILVMNIIGQVSQAAAHGTVDCPGSIRAFRASLAIAFSIFPLLSPHRSRNEIAAAKLGDGLQ